jgi:hypothetical protein
MTSGSLQVGVLALSRAEAGCAVGRLGLGPWAVRCWAGADQSGAAVAAVADTVGEPPLAAATESRTGADERVGLIGDVGERPGPEL